MQNKAFPAVAADFVGALLFIFLLSPFLENLLKNISVRGGSILFFALILAGLALNVLKRLEKNPFPASLSWLSRFDFSNSQRILLALAISVVAIFVLMQANLNNLWGDTVDLFANTGEVHEGEMTLYITFGPIFIWFMAGAVYLAGFALKTEKVIENQSAAYGWVEFVGLLFANILLGLFALYFAGWFGRMFPSLGSGIVFILTLILLELLFIPMRLRHTFRNPQVASVASFLFLMLVTVGFALA